MEFNPFEKEAKLCSVHICLGKPQKGSFLVNGPLRRAGGVKAGPQRKKTFFKAQKKSDKNVATKLDFFAVFLGVTATPTNRVTHIKRLSKHEQRIKRKISPIDIRKLALEQAKISAFHFLFRRENLKLKIIIVIFTLEGELLNGIVFRHSFTQGCNFFLF